MMLFCFLFTCLFKRQVIWRRPVPQLFKGRSFHHLVTRTKKSLDACLPCTLRDDGISQAVLEDQRECGAVKGVITAFEVSGCWSSFGFEGKHQGFPALFSVPSPFLISSSLLAVSAFYAQHFSIFNPVQYKYIAWFFSSNALWSKVRTALALQMLLHWSALVTYTGYTILAFPEGLYTLG